jgi:hypothetical protein
MWKWEFLITMSTPQRIVLIGKIPPIQGGVSLMTLQTALDLQQRGAGIEIVTNRLEVASQYKLNAAEDWPEPYDRIPVYDISSMSEFQHVPNSPCFAERLSGLALSRLLAHGANAVVGWYLFPYGVAAYLASVATGVPLILIHAGSDLARLALHVDLGPLAAQMLNHASAIVTPDDDSRKMLETLGAGKRVVVTKGAYPLPHYWKQKKGSARRRHATKLISGLFGTDIDHDKMSDPANPIFCLYGKLSESRKLHETISAFRSLVESGVSAYLICFLAGDSQAIAAIRDGINSHSSTRETILLFPPLAPWLLAQVVCACDIGICIESSFNVPLHLSRVPREMLAMGLALIVSRDFKFQPVYQDILFEGVNCLFCDDQGTLLQRMIDVAGNEKMLANLQRAASTTSKFFEREIGPGNAYADAIMYVAQNSGYGA